MRNDMRAAVCAAVFSISGLVAGASRADVSDGLESLDNGDVAAAAEAFAAAYDAGDGEGAFYLGRLFELGLGTEQDETRAANLYAAAAEKGSAKAKLRLGLIYHEGRVLLRDYVEGTRLICEASEAGDPDGQLNCGLAYRDGLGVEVDTAKALELFELAASQDNIGAMNVLVQHYLDLENREQATLWARRAADKGNALGMYRLATLLSEADEPDMPQAYAYASLAYVRGLPEAGVLRDTLEGQLSAEDVLAGQRLAREWTDVQIEKLQ